MPPKPSYQMLTPEQRAELKSLPSTGGWWVVSSEALPSAIPVSFRKKLDSAVMVVSGNSVSGTTTLFFNARRIDGRDKAIKHEPFAIVVDPHGVREAGMFLHHGDWPERTTFPPPDFWLQVQVSGVSSYFLATPASGQTAGSLDTLPKGDADALRRVIPFLNKEDQEGT